MAGSSRERLLLVLLVAGTAWGRSVELSGPDVLVPRSSRLPLPPSLNDSATAALLLANGTRPRRPPPLNPVKPAPCRPPAAYEL